VCVVCVGELELRFILTNITALVEGDADISKYKSLLILPFCQKVEK
jgi:hypothetical protein